MGKFKSSTKLRPDSEILACSDETPPFDSLIERNPSTNQRQVYARYKPLSGFFHMPIPGTLHWAVEVVSAEELARNDVGYIWELVQKNGKTAINVSSWTGAEKTRKEFMGYTKSTDEEICDCASDILRHMNTDNFNILDKVTRAYLIPFGAAHLLRDDDPGLAQSYDMLVRNCQDFAKRLKVRICIPIIRKPNKRKRRVIKKTAKILKTIVVGSGKGFLKFGTGVFKRALISGTLSNPQFIQPWPGR